MNHVENKENCSGGRTKDRKGARVLCVAVVMQSVVGVGVMLYIVALGGTVERCKTEQNRSDCGSLRNTAVEYGEL